MVELSTPLISETAALLSLWRVVDGGGSTFLTSLAEGVLGVSLNPTSLFPCLSFNRPLLADHVVILLPHNLVCPVVQDRSLASTGVSDCQYGRAYCSTRILWPRSMPPIGSNHGHVVVAGVFSPMSRPSKGESKCVPSWSLKNWHTCSFKVPPQNPRWVHWLTGAVDAATTRSDFHRLESITLLAS